ncbi:hypothetical protein Dda_7259 [Drechslerella dactyloides]|uniref:Uncharacterized protein n=1 Tax=Drechslerella dactyloides TaxID=74499 RepID=A0AAD6IRY6_DREDA|nr:hypothetical protein Dda_7259 [Drechslerella dactyloides]
MLAAAGLSDRDQCALHIDTEDLIPQPHNESTTPPAASASRRHHSLPRRIGSSRSAVDGRPAMLDDCIVDASVLGRASFASRIGRRHLCGRSAPLEASPSPSRVALAAGLNRLEYLIHDYTIVPRMQCGQRSIGNLKARIFAAAMCTAVASLIAV